MSYDSACAVVLSDNISDDTLVYCVPDIVVVIVVYRNLFLTT